MPTLELITILTTKLRDVHYNQYYVKHRVRTVFLTLTKILDLLVFLLCMQEIGVRPCGMNPKTSVDLYRKVVVPTVLYGCEVWNNLKQRDVDELKGQVPMPPGKVFITC